MNLSRLIVCALVCLPILPLQAEETSPQGSLVIVGGALRASNDAVFDAFLARIPSEGQVGIVPAASGHPQRNADRFRDQLVQRGLAPERITVLPLAVRDDPSTPEVDERQWERNGDDPTMARVVARMVGLWFIGGDQARIMQVLRTPEGAPNATQAAVRQVFQRGGVIGGTSAGAAIQSEVMILGGASPGALRSGLGGTYTSMKEQESGPLKLGEGLGLFAPGIIDQHFDRKGRLGRLIVAVLEKQATHPLGFGIDEDTALVWEPQTQTATVVGSASVVVVDAREAETHQAETAGLRLSVLTPGTKVLLPAITVTPSSEMKATVGQEYHDIPDPALHGLFAPYSGRLEDALGFLLLDNAHSDLLQTALKHPDGSMHHFIFQQDARSRGYWGTPDGALDRYTSLEVGLTIRYTRP